MTFTELKEQIKYEQKQLAKEIRALKATRKEVPCGYVEGLECRRDDYRHTHIAYCQFFNGTPYNMIEPYCEEMPRESAIKSHMTIWESQIDEEIIRRNAA